MSLPEPLLPVWILDDNNRPKRATFREWDAWMQTAERRVAVTELPSGTHVSTVFLAVCCEPWAQPPLLYETAVFYPNGKAPWIEQYATLELAQAGHAAIVEELKGKNE